MLNVSLEGNIGAGKSVFLDELQKVVCAYEEDLAEHGTVDIAHRGSIIKINRLPTFGFLEEVFCPAMLTEFYTKVISAVDFEKYVINVRSEQFNSMKENPVDILITDRCVLSSIPFIHSLKEQKRISDEDYADLMTLCSGTVPDVIIYVEASAGTLLENIKTRGRKYEIDNLDAAALERIEKNYRAFIMNLTACNRGHATKKPCIVLKSTSELTADYAKEMINNYIVQFVNMGVYNKK
jgi:deoxyadenosine/deoxycytidine kinase